MWLWVLENIFFTLFSHSWSSIIDLPIGQWGDDKSRCVAKVLIRVLELSITDVGKAMALMVIPSVQRVEVEEKGEGWGKERKRK